VTIAWDQVLIAAIAAIPPTIAAVGALWATIRGNREVTKVKREVRAARAEARGSTPTDETTLPED
jgi:hypothetical protein